METQEKKATGVSIIICCYNSEARIAKTLEHLAKQVVPPPISWEIVLVDNNCTDDTIRVAQETWKLHPTQTPLIVVKEETPGLSYARKKGLSKVKFDTIIFCDDDNWLSSQYVQIAFDLMQANSQIGVIGGWGVPEWEAPPHDWLLNFAGCYATGPQGLSSGEAAYTRHVYGAGMVIRKEAIDQLDKIGFEGFLTGRKGKSMLAGDDHELCYAIYLCGYKIWYDERLKFKHFIPLERMNLSYLKKILKGFADCEALLTVYKIRMERTKYIDFVLRTRVIYLFLSKSLLLIKQVYHREIRNTINKPDLIWTHYNLHGCKSYFKFFFLIKALRKKIILHWPY